MITGTYSQYYLTKFQAQLLKPLDEQYQAFDWQHPNWCDRKEGYAFAENKFVARKDMDANPYRRYCKKYNLALGSKIQEIVRLDLKAHCLLF